MAWLLCDYGQVLALAPYRLPWLAPFCPRIVSGNVGMIKPEPGIYALALKALRAAPHDVTFIDDRPEGAGQ